MVNFQILIYEYKAFYKLDFMFSESLIYILFDTYTQTHINTVYPFCIRNVLLSPLLHHLLLSCDFFPETLQQSINWSPCSTASSNLTARVIFLKHRFAQTLQVTSHLTLHPLLSTSLSYREAKLPRKPCRSHGEQKGRALAQKSCHDSFSDKPVFGWEMSQFLNIYMGQIN